MSWRMIRFKDRSSEDSRDFEEAMDMLKEGYERMCDLAEEMKEQYGERRGSYGGRGGYYGGRYGMRGGYYGRRDDEMMWDDDYYGERRRRDSRGRYMYTGYKISMEEQYQTKLDDTYTGHLQPNIDSATQLLAQFTEAAIGEGGFYPSIIGALDEFADRQDEVLQAAGTSLMDYADDVDGSKTRAFDEFYAKTMALGIPILWEDVI